MLTDKQIKILDSYTTAYILKRFRMMNYGYRTIPADQLAPIYLQGEEFTRRNLKEYLNTRPHVPNKQESKKERLTRKQTGEPRHEKTKNCTRQKHRD